MERIYACIDLKSFYASVECRERNLDPITTNLVVADSTRTEKTICLAVTPSLKQYGLSGRSRLFEVVQKVKEINQERKKMIQKEFKKKSYNDREIQLNPEVELSYIIAPPRMKLYMEYSTKIYQIYLQFLSKEDIYVYSIDEVFCELTHYLKLYHLTPKELITKMIREVYEETGITATAGIGTNLYLAKVAMDILGKHEPANEQGVRIAELTEKTYRTRLWNHTPITDFWRIGPGIAKRLESKKLYTMGDIAKYSLEHEKELFKLFGVNAELVIDHAWGWEPCTLEEIKNYKPSTTSLSTGQVLQCPYDYRGTKVIVEEMLELLVLDMVEKEYKTNQIVMTIGYDKSNLEGQEKNTYRGDVTIDHYGRAVPKHAHGTIRIDHQTSSTKIIKEKGLELFERIINKNLLTRRINIAVCNLDSNDSKREETEYKQLDLFTNQEEWDKKKIEERRKEKEEEKLQKTIINLKYKYGKNAMLIGTNLKEKATTIERNNQIGGHKA